MSRFTVSPYLSRLASTYGEPVAAPEGWLEALDNLYLDTDESSLIDQMLNLKSQFDLAWAAGRFTNKLQFEEQGRLRSLFAERSISAALNFAWRKVLKDNRIDPTPLKGLFVFGLGKLGAHDLNFSSDVDLIAYYESGTFPVSQRRGQSYIANKVLQTLTRILQPGLTQQLIWRVDWRLRPESSSRGLAMSTQAAQKFYATRALPWHRLALLKARPVAGDKEAGERFLEDIEGFIWRRNLDFRAIDEIGYLKKRINLEHPNLQMERRRVRPISPNLSGFNVKLGRGGIREIEFVANAMQLIWGGRKHLLRNKSTLAVLQGLGQLELLSRDHVDTLQRSYRQLRLLEDAIQMMENNQTHIVPGSDELKGVLQLVGGDFNYPEQISTLRKSVNSIFESVFHIDEADDLEERATPSKTGSIDLSLIKSQRSQEIAQSWLNGFDRHGLAPPDLLKFQALGHHALSEVLSRSTEPDDALQRIDRYFSSIARSGQYFRLLSQNNQLFNAILDPLLHSPHMSELLRQSPNIIDTFLDPQSPVNSAPDNDPVINFITAESNFETQLERIRRFVNEHLFAYYHLFLKSGDSGMSATYQLQRQLTLLAEKTLEASILVVLRHMGLEDTKLSVLGLGKLGANSMAPLSDLDLVFVFEDGCDAALTSKIVRRLNTALSTPLKEGIAYELDMRLRPSGRSGPAAVRFSAFKSHHLERAKTWEHIALMQARSVAGDADLSEEVDAFVREVLRKPRDGDQWIKDAHFMWMRIEKQRIQSAAPHTFNSKLCEGGLMQAEYVQSVSQKFELGFDLSDAIHFWQRVQIWERLFALTGKSAADVPPAYQERFFEGSEECFLQNMHEHKRKVIDATHRLFTHREFEAEYRETNIKWVG